MTPQTPARLHLAIIMDGNGRWATRRGLPRVAGHRRGATAVERAVEAATRAPDVGTLTLYALSADNWQRPADEVALLLQLFDRYLEQQTPRCLEHGIRFTMIGSRDRLPSRLVARAEMAECVTRDCSALHLRLAIDYSAKASIWRACEHVAASTDASREEFDRAVRSGRGTPDDAPDVDLVIRTGGERRLSDFLLWESAYAELWFTDVMWPDFSGDDMRQAINDFQTRDRRYGKLAAHAVV